MNNCAGHRPEHLAFGIGIALTSRPFVAGAVSVPRELALQAVVLKAHSLHQASRRVPGEE